ncbi:MAG: hypothetical protein RIF33_13330 [Cyclobacteriaceae bacterium]
MKSLLLLSLSIIVSLPMFAQMRATTEDGRAVLLMRDNTWRFANQAEAPASYDCNDLTQVDGTKSAAQKPLKISGRNGGSVSFYAQKDGKYVTMLMATQGDEDCMITGSVVNLTFRDGTKMDMKNTGEANCEGRGLLTLGTNDKSNQLLTLLKTKELSSARVWNKSASILATFSPEDSKLMLNTVWCLLGR